MTRPQLIVPLSLAAAGAYAVTGAIGLAHDQGAVFTDPLDYVLEWFFVAGLAATVAVLAILARSAASRATTIGAGLAATGNAALCVAATATAIEGRETLDAAFGVGVLAIVAGYIALTALDVRRRLLPAGLGIVLLAGWFASIPVDVLTGAGGFVLATAWAGVARLTAASSAKSTAAGAGAVTA